MAAAAVTKASGALRTIGEVADETGVPQHILRFWETRFPQLKPLQRAGNRRYYRSEDVALIRRIHDLLDRKGYTIRGVQQLLADEPKRAAAPTGDPRGLRDIRDALANALAADDASA